jgi:hypothetical protein
MNITEYITIVENLTSNFRGIGQAINSSSIGGTVKKDVSNIVIKEINKTSRFLRLKKHKFIRKVRRKK